MISCLGGQCIPVARVIVGFRNLIVKKIHLIGKTWIKVLKGYGIAC